LPEQLSDVPGASAPDRAGTDLPEPAREHLIVHQFDPSVHMTGGVHGFLVDLVRYAPPGNAFRFVGVDSSGSGRLGVWREVVVGGRPAGFLPVARLSAERQTRRIPHALRVVAGLAARRPRAGGALLHAHMVEVGAALRLLYPRSPVVQFVHSDAEAALAHRAETFWRFFPRTQAALERAVVGRADRTYVMSRAAAERLGQHSAKVSAASNWFDDSVFHPAREPAPAGLTVGFVGRLEPSKGPLAAVEVFRGLAERDPGFTGWFAGVGTLEDEVRARLHEHGLADRVELLGTVQPPELAERLGGSACLLVTSLWEGQPRAVLEALGCGVPVVSTDVGDVRRLVVPGETGFVAEEGSPAELVRLVEAAGRLRDRKAVAATVADRRASVAVPALFEELALLAGPRGR
jgi:glycosyltransferase involved in cell wall biosynthesis